MSRLVPPPLSEKEIANKAALLIAGLIVVISLAAILIFREEKITSEDIYIRFASGGISWGVIDDRWSETDTGWHLSVALVSRGGKGEGLRGLSIAEQIRVICGGVMTNLPLRDGSKVARSEIDRLTLWFVQYGNEQEASASVVTPGGVCPDV